MRSPSLRPWLVLALLSLSVGCGGGSDPGGGGEEEVDPGFALHVIEPANGVAVVAAGGEEPIILAVTAPEGERAPTVYLDVEGLPEGVTFHAEAIASNAGRGYLYLIAADDAPEVANVEARIVASTLDGRKARVTVRVTVDGRVVVEPPCAAGLDRSFGTMNCMASAVVGANPVMADLLVQADGSIVAVGYRGDGTTWVAKWDAYGGPDLDFGQAGVQLFEEPFVPEKVAVLPDGSLVLGGRSLGTATAEVGAAVLAFLDGDGLHGFPVLAPGTGSVRALAVRDWTVDASIGLDAGGHVLTRLDLAGGQVYPPAFEGPRPEVAAFAADGSLVAGAAGEVFRFDAEGRWDTSFGESGHLRMTGARFGGVLPLGTGGDFLAAGGVNGDAFLIRVLDGAWDYEFGGLVGNDSPTDDRAYAAVNLTALADGTAIAVHEAIGRDLGVVRYDRTGHARGGVIWVGFKPRTPEARLATDRRGGVLVMAVGTPEAVVVVRIPG